ncbi:beta-ketoacyl synthase N-terminal-like domain-containing protein [Streptomyces sp. NPDC102360]|uniref:beta-ketoacyl synthase N-terminal-like domain-containing protein n=1 Tax=Streptomyces sp. NPDC102360 TaxID=3366160 RepID=UPI003816FCCA
MNAELSVRAAELVALAPEQAAHTVEPAARTVELAVTGVAVVSPWGDTPELAAAGGGVPVPGGPSWFDHRERLGRRGYKYLPAAARYALAAARGARADGGSPDAVPEERRGLLLATNGGLAELFDAMDETVTGAGAEALSPAAAPYFAVNVLGSRLAAELGLKGFALTVANSRTAAVDALATGARALAAGRCDTLLLTAAEEPLPAARGGGGEQGAVALGLEPSAAARTRGARVHGTVLARSLFLPPGRLRTAEGRATASEFLAPVLGALLNEAPTAVLSPVLDDSDVSEAVLLALAGVTAGRPRPGTTTTGPLEPHTGPGAGRHGCLRPALEVVRAVTTPGGPPRLVVTATGTGHVALALVTPHPTSEVPPHPTPDTTEEQAC